MNIRIVDITNKYKEAATKIAESKGAKVVEDRRFDVLIAFLTKENTALGFLVAEAAERQRYVLALVPPDKKENPGVRVSSKFLTLKTFDEYNFEKTVSEYIDHRRHGNLKRFNFVIPEELVRYLEWVPQGKQTSKSDFVRELIQQEMENDQDYKKKLSE